MENLVTRLVLFDTFFIDRGNGLHNMNSDVYKIVFSNDEPDKVVDTTYSDIVEIAPGGGYPTGGLVLPLTGWVLVGDVAQWQSGNINFTATGTVGPFQYLAIYNTVGTEPLVGYYDRSSPITLESGDPFVVFFSLSPIVIREKQVALF